MTDVHSNDLSNDDIVAIIHKSKIFSDIDHKACENLVAKLEKIKLTQGTILFEQGDPSDCLYIIASGQLIASAHTADGKHKVVGSIDKGETVGELGVISNQPRSLTICATKNCLLLKLSNEQFKEFCKENKKFIISVVDLIIQRSQHALKIIAEKKLYQHVAIIKGNDNVPLDKFIKKIKENFYHEYNFILQLDNPQDIPIWKILETMELQNKSVIFVFDENNFTELQTKLNHIGGVYVIVDGDRPGKLSEFASNILDQHKILFTHANHFELVLLHDDSIKRAAGTAEWLKQTEFTLHHHIRINTHSDYQRLLRFMMDKAIGLVLGGGGNKGWVSLGALKALLEANFPIDIIGGSSIGAIVGASYLLSLDYQTTEDTFEKLILCNANPFSFKNITWPIISLVSTKNSTHTLQEVFADIQIEDLLLPFFTIASNLSSGKEISFNSGTLWEVLRATVALPGIVPPMVIGGELYLDGGLVNNLPVDDMRRLLGHDSTIIAVSLTSTSEFVTDYHFPPVLPFYVGLLRKLKLAYQDYSFPSYFNMFVQAMLLGSSTKERKNQLSADLLICPDLTKFKSLEFGTKKKIELIEIGYQATKKQLKSYKARSHKWKYKYDEKQIEGQA